MICVLLTKQRTGTASTNGRREVRLDNSLTYLTLYITMQQSTYTSGANGTLKESIAAAYLERVEMSQYCNDLV